jgi:hypothetical protein
MLGCVTQSRIILNTMTFDWMALGVLDLFGFVGDTPNKLGTPGLSIADSIDSVSEP